MKKTILSGYEISTRLQILTIIEEIVSEFSKVIKEKRYHSNIGYNIEREANKSGDITEIAASVQVWKFCKETNKSLNRFSNILFSFKEGEDLTFYVDGEEATPSGVLELIKIFKTESKEIFKEADQFILNNYKEAA